MVKVAIVEDDVRYQQQLKKYLEQYGEERENISKSVSLMMGMKSWKTTGRIMI